MNKTIFILLCTFSLAFNSAYINSQVSVEWTRRYTSIGAEEDKAKDITTDGSGNVYVTGYVTSLNGGINTFTVKYSSGGIVLWSNAYDGGYGVDEGNEIAVDGEGSVYITGFSAGNGSSSDYITIKYNSAGVQQWVQRYNGPANSTDQANSLAVDGSGNVYITGFSSGSGSSFDYATLKYNSAGVQQWIARYNGPGNAADIANSLAVDGSGNVYVTGHSSGTGYDYATLKYNSAGTQLWAARYNGPGSGWDQANSLAVDGSGNVYVTGYSAGSGSANDYATLKYNSAGVQQWVQRYNGPANNTDQAYSLALDGSGNVYITGSSTGSGSSFDYATLKYNSAGVQQWIARYNGPGNAGEEAGALALDAAGNIYVTGFGYFGTNYDYLTLRYNPAGTQIWEHRYNGTGNASDIAGAIAISSTGIVYVTGESTGSGSGADLLTIKYSQTVGIENTESEIPAEFSLGQNYPNPFNPMTNIKIQMPNSGFVKLTVFDITGKEIAILVNEELNAGVYNVGFDAGNLSSGTYFYRMETAGFTEVKKMVLVK